MILVLMDEVAARQALQTLARARGVVALGPFGAAAAVTPELRAYEALLAEPRWLGELRPELEAMAREGAPPRRIYAVLLLRSIDGVAAKAVLEAMLGSEEPCDLFPGGCVKVSRTLGGTAAFLLGRIVQEAPIGGLPPVERVAPPSERDAWLRRTLGRWLARL